MTYILSSTYGIRVNHPWISPDGRPMERFLSFRGRQWVPRSGGIRGTVSPCPGRQLGLGTQLAEPLEYTGRFGQPIGPTCDPEPDAIISDAGYLPGLSVRSI